MKKIILILLVLTMMYSCETTDNKADSNTALIEKYIQAVEDLDFTAMDSMLDDNYVGLGPSINDSIRKKEAVTSWKNNVENLYESVTYNKSKNIAVIISTGENKGEWVSNWAELNIVYKSNKKSITIMANTIYQIKDNKIIKSYSFYNEADALKQLGYVFINPDNL
jgi:hypothetical protein